MEYKGKILRDISKICAKLISLAETLANPTDKLIWEGVNHSWVEIFDLSRGLSSPLRKISTDVNVLDTYTEFLFKVSLMGGFLTPSFEQEGFVSVFPKIASTLKVGLELKSQVKSIRS